MTFIVGPDNPDFVPFAQVSPHLINAIMTTEDSGFFKHRGWGGAWVSRRPCAATSKTTGSGWAPRHHHADGEEPAAQQGEDTVAQIAGTVSGLVPGTGSCPKSAFLSCTSMPSSSGRGSTALGQPRGTTSARPRPRSPHSRAAFFSSILPSPKRRYVHYCHGSLSPAWEKYLRRI